MDKLTYFTIKLHYDEEDKTIYKTTRVVEENGFIVVYRKKKYPNGKFASREDRNPIYAKVVVNILMHMIAYNKSSFIAFPSYYIAFSTKKRRIHELGIFS